jgi:acetyl-CoA synthetase
MNISSIQDFEKFYEQSKSQSDSFWLERAKEYQWQTLPKKTLEGSFTDLPVKWFSDGKLNITVNCLDRHAAKTPEKTAIIFEPNDPKDGSEKISYKELLVRVNKFANVLKSLDVQKGDVVCFYMSMIPDLLVGILACARIGAVHCVVFGGFSAAALAERIRDCSAKVIVTNDVGARGAKTVALKEVVDEAQKSCPTLQAVLVRLQKNDNVLSGKEKNLQQLLEKASSDCEPVFVAAEDPLFILYTSGSTGKPKGLLHTVGGYMVWVGETFKNVFQYKQNDIFWCTADIGWITGHSYIVYGPLLNGATQVMYEGLPNWPDSGRFWEVIDKHQVTHFYTAPTAIRALEAADIQFVRKHQLTSLKVLGSVGEPINEEAWQWYFKEVGKERCPIVDTWWQTETGGIMMSSIAGITPSIPTEATLPFPGVFPVLMTPEGEEITGETAEGSLCLRQPWPGIARTIYNDHDRYVQTYFSTFKGKYFTGDGARRDRLGNYRIIGRIDDVVNVSGHRIGTAEVEDAINEHASIVESAVIGVPHPIKGQCIVAFVIANGNSGIPSQEVLSEVNILVSKMIGPIAKLEQIFIVSGLPKTRSGKIMRRVLRKAYEGDRKTLGDTSTLVNPEIVEEIFSALNNKV